MEKKLSFVHEIKKRKSIIEGQFSNKVTNQKKNEAWEELLKFAKSIGLVTENYTKDKLRDQTWGNWKRRAKEKFDKSRTTGTGKVKLTALDEAVLEVLGKDSPSVVGMNISDSDKDNYEDVEESVTTPVTNQENRESPLLQVASLPLRTRVTKDKFRKRNSKSNMSTKTTGDTLLEEKKRAQINFLKASTELLQCQKYETKLKCLALERQLQLPPSAVTSSLTNTSCHCPNAE